MPCASGRAARESCARYGRRADSDAMNQSSSRVLAGGLLRGDPPPSLARGPTTGVHVPRDPRARGPLYPGGARVARGSHGIVLQVLRRQRGRFTAALTARTMLAEHMFGPHNGSPITISNPEEFAMPKLKLTYFDFDGGRGEPARLALHIGGIAFEDHRISGKDWPGFRDMMPFLAMPTLEVDGRVVSQSNSINRYVGRLACTPRMTGRRCCVTRSRTQLRTSAPTSHTPSIWPRTPRRRRAKNLLPGASRDTWTSFRPG